MESTARLYNCARCHSQVIICGHCDRGNLYCGRHCAQAARKASLIAAGKRYQHSYRGRLKHAERQRHYRSRREKVTHQGSPQPPTNDPLATRSQATASVAITEVEGIRCHFCARLCSAFLRLDFIQRTSAPLASDQKIIHRSPPGWAQAP